ncbi:Transcriptional regulator (GntR-family protein) [Desulfamplus magnetovallimortis]|uniref:Transcriptional regulator (GntR-family protein) n=1 Tax=Desulfamplus magnetovallimortis TaxID=1246637 RepID=A0A1W1H4Y7_9BACT|nr:FadR/GntR family transcriptional regulator [Desulfamplus magnetovallimortis]SLM27543.1 Transcriptional regulator (GntR-family protein) [Desulfamplus magnetovallimortis]
MQKKNRANFQKAKKSRVFQDVVGQIQDAILDGKLSPGDKLPPERELQDTFNVSRGTLREALRVLEQKGLIEIRLGTGGGSMVREAGAEQLTETLALMIRSGRVSVLDIGEFREGMEGRIASLAADRASEDDIRKLEELLNQAVSCSERGKDGWEDFLDVDEAIHKEVARIAGNALYRYSAQVVHDNIRSYYDQYLEFSSSRIHENRIDLEQLVNAIKSRNGEEAARIAEKHVHAFNVRMREKEAMAQGKN